MDSSGNSTYQEDQNFSQWWLWTMLILINGALLFALIKQIFFDQAFGTAPMSDRGIITTFIGMVLFSILLLSFRLKTTIDGEGIHVKFFPFHRGTQDYSWADIKTVYVRKYNPLLEYGGWGWRYGIFGKGKAYNMSGRVGMQIEFKDGKRLLVGTRRGEELSQFLEDHQEWFS